VRRSAIESKIKPLLNTVETAFKQLHKKVSYSQKIWRRHLKTQRNEGFLTGQLLTMIFAMAKSLKEDVFCFRA
jgi:hypothetical protein